MLLSSPKPNSERGRLAAGSRVEEATLERRGDFWSIELAARQLSVRHSRGMSYLSLLLGNPGVEFHVVEMQSGAAPPAGPQVATDGLRGRTIAADDAGPHLDARAKADYRARVEALRETIQQAEAFNDLEHAARAREELEAIGAELARAVGFGGRDRRAGSAAERARINVTRAIRTAIRRIAKYDPALGYHLERSVRTGAFCCYRGSLERPISWVVETEES